MNELGFTVEMFQVDFSIGRENQKGYLENHESTTVKCNVGDEISIRSQDEGILGAVILGAEKEQKCILGYTYATLFENTGKEKVDIYAYNEITKQHVLQRTVAPNDYELVNSFEGNQFIVKLGEVEILKFRQNCEDRHLKIPD